MIKFKQYSEIISKISKKLKVSKDVATAALVKAQEKGIDIISEYCLNLIIVLYLQLFY